MPRVTKPGHGGGAYQKTGGRDRIAKVVDGVSEGVKSKPPEQDQGLDADHRGSQAGDPWPPLTQRNHEERGRPELCGDCEAEQQSGRRVPAGKVCPRRPGHQRQDEKVVGAEMQTLEVRQRECEGTQGQPRNEPRPWNAQGRCGRDRARCDCGDCNGLPDVAANQHGERQERNCPRCRQGWQVEFVGGQRAADCIQWDTIQIAFNKVARCGPVHVPIHLEDVAGASRPPAQERGRGHGDEYAPSAERTDRQESSDQARPHRGGRSRANPIATKLIW